MMLLAYRVCRGCGVRYLQADFLAYRVAGYCTEECSHYERRGVPTAECVGWKNGIPASTQRKKFEPPPTSELPLRKWSFDLVRVPPVTGAWELVNWQLIA